jgi:hypothetical protein
MNFVWSHREKEWILHNYFQERLGACEQRAAIIMWSELEMSSLANQHLDQSFTEPEIRPVVNELPTEKAPALDRFACVFFKSRWEVIKHDVMATFHCIYT